MSYIRKRIERRGLSVKEEERREKRRLVILRILELERAKDFLERKRKRVLGENLERGVV